MLRPPGRFQQFDLGAYGGRTVHPGPRPDEGPLTPRDGSPWAAKDLAGVKLGRPETEDSTGSGSSLLLIVRHDDGNVAAHLCGLLRQVLEVVVADDPEGFAADHRVLVEGQAGPHVLAEALDPARIDIAAARSVLMVGPVSTRA
jgi:hypothetical protein